jgi:uncharacterized protein (TIGR01777 family)
VPTVSSSIFLPVTPAEAYAWHLRPGALERLVPPWERLPRQPRPDAPLVAGSEITSALPGPFGRQLLTTRIEALEPDAGFSERQIRGPFLGWRHHHRFEPEDDGCRMRDEIAYDLPSLGRLQDESIHRQLSRRFAWRSQRALADLGRLRDIRGQQPLRVAVSGVGGLIGSGLCSFLRSGGHTVLPIRRGVPSAADDAPGIAWDPAAGAIQVDALAGVDAVVHLAGASVGVRWSAAARRRIVESRVLGTRLLAQTLARLPQPPPTLIVASATGWYGDRGDQLLDEAAEAGAGFLPEVCTAWEAACEPARAAGIRVVNLRIGLVLSGRGGVLSRLRAPFALGLGVVFGDGRQWSSWLAFDDLIYLLHHALATTSLSGPVNAVAPAPVRHLELIETLGHILDRRLFLRLPAGLVRTVFGPMGQELLLSSARVLSRALEAESFAFSYPDLAQALRWELGRPRPLAPEESPGSWTD